MGRSLALLSCPPPPPLLLAPEESNLPGLSLYSCHILSRKLNIVVPEKMGHKFTILCSHIVI